jgi:hypothetical protein
MPLLSLWQSNPTAVGELTIEQVVATAGDGLLKDGSVCSNSTPAALTTVVLSSWPSEARGTP